MDKFTETYLNIIELGKIKDFATWAKEGLNGSRKADKKNAAKERKQKMDEWWDSGNISKLIDFIESGDSDFKNNATTRFYYGMLLFFNRKKPPEDWKKRFENGEDIFNTNNDLFKKGLNIIIDSAKNGSIDACIFLSQLFGADSKGQDLKEAKKWLRRAKLLKQKQSYEEQKYELKRQNKDKEKLTETLTTDDETHETDETDEKEKTEGLKFSLKNKVQQVKKAIWDLLNKRGITNYQKQLLIDFIS